MFTGIVTDIGTVAAVTDLPQGKRFRVRTSYDPQTIAIGASIACAGVCLTTVGLPDTGSNARWFEVEAWEEALRLTTAGDWAEGTPINLERALRAGDEYGGHMVSGHVDAMATIADVKQEGEAVRFVIEAPGDLMRFIAPKGSVALDGTSLTVNGVQGDLFDVLLIRHSLDVTTWGQRRAGDRVNLEIIKTLRDKLQVLVDENRNLNDEIFKEQQINKKYFARYNEQLEKVAALTKALIVAGVDPNEATKSGAGELPPPEVQGLVLDAKQNTRSGVEWIEVSIGSNDGLKEGHELHVYRFGDGNGKKAKYLGRIKLVLLTADKAVGTVIDKAKNGVIERGDNVTTKL